MSSTTVRPFADSHVIEHLGDGRFRARLDETWAIGDKAFGGLLMTTGVAPLGSLVLTSPFAKRTTHVPSASTLFVVPFL